MISDDAVRQDPVTVEWRWQLRPWCAWYLDRRGNRVGIARWTRYAAEARATDIWISYTERLLRVAQEDARAGRHAMAESIYRYLRDGYNPADPDPDEIMERCFAEQSAETMRRARERIARLTND